MSFAFLGPDDGNGNIARALSHIYIPPVPLESPQTSSIERIVLPISWIFLFEDVENSYRHAADQCLCTNTKQKQWQPHHCQHFWGSNLYQRHVFQIRRVLNFLALKISPQLRCHIDTHPFPSQSVTFVNYRKDEPDFWQKVYLILFPTQSQIRKGH